MVRKPRVTQRFQLYDGVDRIQLLETLGRYTRFVNVSKTLLITLTVLLLGALVVLPVLRKDSSGVRIAFTKTEQAPDATPIMKNPKFQGQDSSNQPYMVTADSAIQQDKDTVVLQKVSADMTLNDKSWMLVTAKQGTLSLPEQTLVLRGEVTVFHDGGYEIHTDRMRVDMKNALAHGDRRIKATGPIGALEADRFAAYNRGELMRFEGQVKMTILPR